MQEVTPMTEYVQFYVHCSRTKQRYIVSGYVKNNILVWAAAFMPRPGTTLNASAPLSRSYAGFDVSAFRCPCCETPGVNNGTNHSSWICSTCGAQHCMGTDNNGNCHGACGKCVYPRASFDGAASTVVQVATGNDR